MENVSELSELLEEFKSLHQTVESQSIFDIVGYPHYENVCSNILAFYLNPNNEHGLGNLFLSSLMSLVGEDEYEVRNDNFQIEREFYTLKGGRIDIIFETDNYLVGIENKLFHHLNNDLADYSNTLEEKKVSKEIVVIKIILSLREEKEREGFKCITYENLWIEIKKQLGFKTTTSSQKWLLYLIDFMKTIENLQEKKMKLDSNDKFVIENYDKFEKLNIVRNNFFSKLISEVSKLKELMGIPEKCEKQWIYAKRCLVHEFNLSGNKIKFDLLLEPSGWELTMFVVGKYSESCLAQLVLLPPFNQCKEFNHQSRLILEKFELETELEVVKDSLNYWINNLLEAEGKIGKKRLN